MNTWQPTSRSRTTPEDAGDVVSRIRLAPVRKGVPVSFPPDCLGWIRGFFHSRAATPEDADDLSQEVFLQACRQWSSFVHRCTLRTWLFSIARHVLADYYRQRRFHPSVWPGFSNGNGNDNGGKRGKRDGMASVVRRDAAGLTTVEARDLLAHCLACLETRLTLPQQVAELLGDVFGYRDREAARLMHCTLPRYKHLLHKGRSHLRQISGDACPLVNKTGVDAICRQPPARPPPPPLPAPARERDAATPLRQLQRQLHDGLRQILLG